MPFSFSQVGDSAYLRSPKLLHTFLRQTTPKMSKTQRSTGLHILLRGEYETTWVERGLDLSFTGSPVLIAARNHQNLEAKPCVFHQNDGQTESWSLDVPLAP